ncbi:ribosomal protein S18 acetylase RimI-like enzyme [Kribbella steppae]|uniref:Ribosomal protein S18 acetylase RimI-like enzyme n=1 Tax=Kribbella steppae TaxID=2512223 RepID=A0A4V2RZ05_9ACTN|nr:GNAT family N-acetyltransferase [Kribbella steppae]TCO23366.1 ribosomal protein S18 acetylase RimI-like enzyme [Kribbella steppae]
MTAVLPDTYTVRPPAKEDAEAVLALVSAYNTAVVGFADYTLDDAVDALTEPGFEPETDGWLVFAGDTPIGYGWVFGKGDHHLLDIDLFTADPAVETYLLGQIVRRARELAVEYGHSSVQLDAVVYRADEPRRRRLTDDGFRPGTTFHRMRIDHDGPVETPVVPAGVTVRRGAPDEASRRVAHAVMTKSFEGQFGFTPRTFEEWHAAHENHSAFDWSQVTLLEVDGQPVALLESNDQFVEDENCGHIGRLCVLAEARGRGLAKFLLRDQFALDAAAGRTGTILHVDTNNPTPALDLYLAVGMRAALVIDVWRLEVVA